MANVNNYKLNDGNLIPQLGLGVYLMKDKNQFMDALNWAFEAGYRHIDTAAYYGNEEWLGEAIRNSGIPRNELFITSKLWNSDHGYQETIDAFQKTMAKLGLDYLDLYLIHWPSDNYIESWQAMEELQRKGMIKSIGVSNFQIHHLEDLMSETDVVPAVDQVETHPYFQQTELRAFLKKHGIAHEAWGPLGQGKSDLFTNSILTGIAEKYNKSVAQVILRWHIQRDTIVIPKSVHQNRLQENIDVFDFELTDDEMKQIGTLDKNQRQSHSPDDKEFLRESAKNKID